MTLDGFKQMLCRLYHVYSLEMIQLGEHMFADALKLPSSKGWKFIH